MGQREIKRSNYASHIGQILEAVVEGYNRQQAQVIGRTLESKTLNFTSRTPSAPLPAVMFQCGSPTVSPAALSARPSVNGAALRS